MSDSQDHATARRDAFRVQLSNALGPLADAIEIQATAVSLLGEHLGVSRAFYGEVTADDEHVDIARDYAPGTVSVAGCHRVDDFGAFTKEAYRAGRTLVVSDTWTDARIGQAERDALNALEVRAYIAIPLVKGGRFVAILGIHNTTPRAFSKDEVALAEDTAQRTWADVARAGAEDALVRARLERARVEEAHRQNEAQLAIDLAGMRRLHELHAKLASEKDLKVALGEIIVAAAAFTDTDRGCVQLVSDDGERLEMFAWYGYEESSRFIQHFRFDGSKVACDAARRHKTRLISDDIASSPLFAGSQDREVALSEDIRAAQSTPLIDRGGELIGVLSTQFRRPHRPTDDALRLVDLLAWTAADFVERHRANAALRASEELKAFTLRLSDLLRPVYNAAEIQEIVTTAARDYLNADRSYYCEIEDQKAVIRRDASRTGLASVVGVYPLQDHPIFSAVINAGKPFVVEDSHTTRVLDEDLKLICLQLQLLSFVIVPVIKRGETVGLFCVTQSSPRRWTSLEVDLATETAERAWIAVERTRAEGALREREARQAFLLQLSDVLSRLTDPDEMVDAVGARLGPYCNLSTCVFVDVHEERQEVVVHHGWNIDEVPSLKQTFRIADYMTDEFQRAGRAGETTIVRNTATDARVDAQAYAGLKVGSFVLIPFHREGRWTHYFAASAVDPREWTADDINLFRDVSDRVFPRIERARAEQAVRRSEERLRRMVNVPRVGVITFSQAGALLDANDAFLDMVGYTREALHASPRTWRDFTPQEYVESSERFMAQLLETGLGAPYEKEYLRKDGSRIWMMFVAADLGDGTIIEYAVDISDRKRAEQRAQLLLTEATVARALAEDANRAKDDFLATLSHELRTPLAAILLWAGALRTGAVAADDLARAVAAISDSAESQSRLIEDLLDLSRLAAGKVDLVLSAVDVSEIARAAIEMIKPAAAAKELELFCEIEPDLTHAMLDGGRVKQILWNLLTNATKFTPARGRITVRVRRHGGQLEIDVADNGQGIAPEFMPHIFERFRQADMGDTRQHMGLGIGLALAQQLATLHGGTIEADSAGLGRGALFRVRLPWVEPAPDLLNEGSLASAAASTSALHGVCVLVVEDDTNTREAMRWMLRHAGADVSAVASGEAALAVLQLESPTNPNVIVVDLGLPGMSGYELIENIAARCDVLGKKVPPACAVSARARDADRDRALAAGFDVYLTKPLSSERLVQAVLDLKMVAQIEL